MSAILKLGIDSNTQFLRHYKKLDEKFASPQECFEHHLNEHKQQIEQKIHQKFTADPDSILGTYHRVNPNLEVPEYNVKIVCHESDRRTITRYRTGCHMLRIQAGRLTGERREARLCNCRRDVQSLHHVLFSCPMTEHIRLAQRLEHTTIQEFFQDGDFTKIATMLKAVAKQLKI